MEGKMSQQDDLNNYEKLHSLSKQRYLLSGVSSILDWDQETYMPKAAGGVRAEQQEMLKGLIHQQKTSPAFVKALSKLIDPKTGKLFAKTLPPEKKAALQCWRKDYLTATALPEKFVKAYAKLTSESINKWRNARANNSFKEFLPSLEKIVTMNREKAQYLGYTKHPYDALLDEFEPDITTEEVTKLFSTVKKSIVQLLRQIKAAKSIDNTFLFGSFPSSTQLIFGEKMLAEIGYRNDRGRVDLSTHPFSSSAHPTDSRITTRIHPNSLISNISVLLHEAGHSFYEMGLPVEHYGSPLCEAVSLGIHESQSRFWETRIGQSKYFWKYYLPKLKSAFKGKFDPFTLEAFYRAINKVAPSFIRVEADEVTYPLHIILRFELEKALIEGSLKVADLPEAWNSKSEELLGIRPKRVCDGCLQDIHWSMGAFGYFPTYSLGNMYTAHLFNKFEDDHPDWEKRVAKGDFCFVRDWLSDKVYRHGRRYSSKELLKTATGRNFNSKAYIDYLNSKYQEIYKL